MRREDRQPLLLGRDDHCEKPLLAGRKRRLVTVVPVGDKKLRVRELLHQRLAELGVEPPEAVAAALEIRLAEPVDVDRAVPEEEERLKLRPRRAEQAEAPLLRPGMRELVRQDDAVFVRLDAKR